MLAVLKRDFRAYFISPIGFVFCAFYLLAFNLFFYLVLILSQSSDMAPLFSSMQLMTVLLMPVLTMRMFSEEFRQGTWQLLFASPVRPISIVMGKYLAAFGVFLLTMLCTLLYLIIISVCGGTVLFASTLGNYAAFIALSAALIAIGMFFSSLTENQIIAAVSTWGVFLGLYIIYIALSFPQLTSELPDWLRETALWLSMFSRYDNFTRGLFSLSDIVFYLSVCAAFIFLTNRVLEKKRMS